MKIWIRVLAGVIGLIYLLAGAAKLSGQDVMIESFNHFNLPQWFVYFIGAAEVAGGIGLLIPKLLRFAAMGLFSIMLGAIATHLVFDPATAAMPAFVLGLLLSLIVWQSNIQIMAVSEASD